eukprot:CAMPEP_0118873598 /NCGR_PEP_ID=MMETSP1163-20130328/15343_1 /TAXON_ID=124430 /ORGANISM="Phaeomonas parva, Strain CCMP2877" /LENGTH=110 /DNA_ID=CAMNT_0006808889 /DNA_START=24 /DNA_END=353 /DNA_ORIENTATION=+
MLGEIYQLYRRNADGLPKFGSGRRSPTQDEADRDFEAETQAYFAACLYDGLLNPGRPAAWLQAGLAARQLLYHYADRDGGNPYALYGAGARLNPSPRRAAQAAVAGYISQ